MANQDIWNDPINKHTDWGGDESTGGLPVSGEQVQKFIKDNLQIKAGCFKLDNLQENYLVFADEEDYALYMSDPTQYANLLIATIPFSSSYYVEVDLQDTQQVNYVQYGSVGNYINAYFKLKNLSGAELSDDFQLTISFRNGSAVTSVNRSATYGTLFSMNIDDYLSVGTNVITIAAKAVNYMVGTSMSVVFYAIKLIVSDDFNISNVYGQENDTVVFPVDIIGTGTTRLEWFLDGVQLPFDAQTDETNLTETTLTKFIQVDNLSEGRHNIQYRAATTINSTEFYSDTKYRDIIVYHGITLNPIIVNAFTYNSQNIIDPITQPIPLGGVEQYLKKEIAYAIYNPANVAVNNVTITLGSNELIVNVANSNVYVYKIKSESSGIIPLSFTFGADSITYNVDVSESTMDLFVIGQTEFEFEGNARTNSSTDKDLANWSFNPRQQVFYHASMSGFAFTEQNGWNPEGLLIGAGATLQFYDFAPFSYNTLLTGATFEVEFETRRVLRDDEVICDLRDNGVGILITASQATITSRDNVVLSTRYKSEERTRITFVINPLSSGLNRGLVFVFVNGVLSGVKNFLEGDSFTSNTNLVFSGSSNAQLLLTQVRFYRRALVMSEVLNNFILYRPTVDEMINAYDRNDILDEHGNPSVDKLSAATPIIIITGNVQKLQNFTKADKSTYVKMDKIEIINLQDPTRNLILLDASMRVQGTSSLNYPWKNFRFYTQADNADKDPAVGPYTTRMFDYLGVEHFGEDRLYSFKGGNKPAQPVNCWCLKADYAESTSTHNTGVARIWNTVMTDMIIDQANIDPRYCQYKDVHYTGNTPCRTMAQQAALDNGYLYDVRTTVDGYPIVMFYHEHEEDDLIFLGKYNWNNDKSTEAVYGFRDIPGFDNSDVECWEVVNGDFPENLYTDISAWFEDIQYDDKTMKGWERSFEARYPDKNTNTEKFLYPFAQWINGLKTASKVQNDQVVVDDRAVMARFTEEKWQHLDVYKMAGVYIYLYRFGAVDQVVKNAMATTEDGRHLYYILYDNDSINGKDNNGVLIFGYLITRQSRDPRTINSYCYAGHDSVLWNNLEADEDFMRIVKQVDQALYSSGLTYSAVIDMFNVNQAGKWSERVYNIDAQLKYLNPYLQEGNSIGLSKLQGNLNSFRQWWLSNRFARYDAINVTGAYKANVFLFRTDTVNPPEQLYAYVTPAITGQVYGYGQGGVPAVAGVEGTVDVPIEMAMPIRLYIGASLDFYNSVFIKKLDVSDIGAYLTEVNLSAINSEAFDCAIEELILGSRISAPNIGSLTALTNLGSMKYLKKLSICSFHGLTSVDLSNNVYLEEFDSTYCQNLSNVAFADAAPLKNLYFSAALQRLSLREITTLQTLQLENNGANISIINLRSCSIAGFTDSPSRLYAWMNARGDAAGTLEVYIDNINWSHVDTAEIIAFGNYVQSRGTLTLRGTCALESLTLEQVETLRATFGNNCFDADAALRFIATGIFFVGPEEVISAGQYQYAVINATGASGTISYSVITPAGTGASMTNAGVLTVPEVLGSDATITIRATFVDVTTGDIFNQLMDVLVKRRIYPANLSIEGPGRVESSHTYTWTTTTEGVNTLDLMYAEWTLTGDITNSVRIASQNNQSCILELFGDPVNESGTLTVSLKRLFDDSTVRTGTLEVSAFNNLVAFTRASNPYLMEVMHYATNINGDPLAAHEDYMTKIECNAVVSSDLYRNAMPTLINSIFYYNPGPHGANYFRDFCRILDELKWFTGLTEIPGWCFANCVIEEITIPENVVELKENSLAVLRGLKKIDFVGTQITLAGYGCFGLQENGTVRLDVDVTVSFDDSNGAIYCKNNTILTIKKIVRGTTKLIAYSSLRDTLVLTIEDFGTDFSLIDSRPLIPVSENVTVFIDSKTPNRHLPDYFISGAESSWSGKAVYLSDKIISVGRIGNLLNLYCEGNITSILNSSFTESYSLYLLNNTSLPTILPTYLYLTGKCIYVRHDMLAAFQGAFPTIADHFTDGFIPVGNPLDVQITGEDVIGQAIGTIIHVRRQYNGIYADGTTGIEWLEEDIEQFDDFFPQNETNVPVQRTITLTIDGFTRSCTITQSIIDYTNCVKIKAANDTVCETVIASTGNQNQLSINNYVDSVYISNKKMVTYVNESNVYRLLLKNSITTIEDQEVLIKLKTINYTAYDIYWTATSISNYIKEIDFTCLTKPIYTASRIFYNQTHLTRVKLNSVLNRNYSDAFCGTKLEYLEILDSNAVSNVDAYTFYDVPTGGIIRYPYYVDNKLIEASLPLGWTVKKIYPPYLEFKSVNSFNLAINNSTKNWDGTLQYSTDKETWTTWDGTTTLNAVENDGNYCLYLRGSNNTYITGDNNQNYFVLTGYDIECNGDLRTLLDYEDPENTTMSVACFAYLFYNCTALTKAPDLPATTLADKCYREMFRNCRIVTPPELPALGLSSQCYFGMFLDCTSLTIAPILPATTLAHSCYCGMFQGCTSLIKSPIIKATTLAPYCYDGMFYDCSSLNEITLAYNATFESSRDWVNGVATQGTFKKNPNLAIATGTSGIPTGWTVEDLDPPYLEYSSQAAFSIRIVRPGWHNIMEYSTNLVNWIIIDKHSSTTILAEFDGINYKLYFRGKGNVKVSESTITAFDLMNATTAVECNGDIRTLLDYEDPENTIMANNCFSYLFSQYNQQEFHLTKAPKLPALELSEGCYAGMFHYCKGLVESPILPARVLRNNSYASMFHYCTSLNKITCLATDISARNSTSSWTLNVSTVGTFYKDASMIHWSRNSNGIPYNWTVVDIT